MNARSAPKDRPSPLADVRVLDFSGIVAGAYCTRLLADLGADVVKIEPLGGEMMRHVDPQRDGCSAYFAALNSGKRALAMDLKNPAAIDLCKRLVLEYDVVVENFAPGVAARLGIDYPTLAAQNPHLIMCSISGFGQAGPDAGRPAYAPIVQAHCGYETLTQQYQPGLDKPLNMGSPVGDTTASLQAFGAVNAALYFRERSGIGQHIDIAMQDALLATMHGDFQRALIDGSRGRYYGPVKARDGHLVVMPLSSRHLRGLAQCLQRPDLIDDERFSTTSALLRNFRTLTAIIEDWTVCRSADDAVASLSAAQVPCAKYRSFNEVAVDTHLDQRGMMTEIEDAAGPLLMPNTPMKFSYCTAAVKRTVPRVGEHTAEVLRDILRLDDDEISSLHATGAVALDVRGSANT